ncbi:hypothetical protein HanRHA438_Chr02g0092281 [Helianthus annuus]|nr:hypothetical protein HanRHA438_Chr02g0092281 [Helianthus annuus]
MFYLFFSYIFHKHRFRVRGKWVGNYYSILLSNRMRGKWAGNYYSILLSNIHK